VRILSSTEELLEETRRLLAAARKKILVSTYVFDWIDAVKDILLDKAAHGVKVEILMADPNSEMLCAEVVPEIVPIVKQRTTLLRKNGVEVYFTEFQPAFRGTIVDDRVALITSPYSPLRGHSAPRHVNAYFITQEMNTVKQYVGCFESMASATAHFRRFCSSGAMATAIFALGTAYLAMIGDLALDVGLPVSMAFASFFIAFAIGWWKLRSR
jgi:hypothetical protein